jgi:hypothetical protein
MRLASAAILLIKVIGAFETSAIEPTAYDKGDEVPLLVGSMTSPLGGKPFDIYSPLFNFCKPSE